MRKRTKRVKVTRLRTDSAYQQEPSQAFVDSLVRDWDSRLAGVITVAKEGRDYFIIDGRTRAKAAKLRGVRSLPAVVLYGYSLKARKRFIPFWQMRQQYRQYKLNEPLWRQLGFELPKLIFEVQPSPISWLTRKIIGVKQ